MDAPPRFTWSRVGDRYPELADQRDWFLAFDCGVEVGAVKWLDSDSDSEFGWHWSIMAVQPAPAFPGPTHGLAATRGEAVRALAQCYAAFIQWGRSR